MSSPSAISKCISIKRRCAILLSILFLFSLENIASAGMIVMFSPDADNLANTVVSISGSGSTNDQAHWLNGPATGYYDLGNPFSSVLSDDDFYLTDDLFFIDNQRIVFLRLDDDGIPENDDFAIFTNMSIPTNTPYALSGIARVPGLPFAWLNVGTYTTNRQPIGNADSSFAVGGFTLVISSTPVRVDPPVVPEPSMMIIGSILGLGGVFAKRRFRQQREQAQI